MGPPELAAAAPPLDHLCGFSRASMFIQMDHTLSLPVLISIVWTMVVSDPNSKSDMEVSNSYPSLGAFIYLAVLVLVASCGIFNWGMWDLIPQPGMELGPPALGVRSLSHWTTREVPLRLFKNLTIVDLQYCVSFRYIALGFFP